MNQHYKIRGVWHIQRATALKICLPEAEALNAISHKEQLNSNFEDLLEAEKIWRNFNHRENSHISAGFCLAVSPGFHQRDPRKFLT